MITELSQWQLLIAHQQEMSKIHLRNLLQTDTERFEQFSIISHDLLLDYSKNHINQTTITLLENLAKTLNLDEKINAIFSGKNLNFTEKRPALHIAFRQPMTSSIIVNNENVMPIVQAILEKMAIFSEQIRTQIWRGFRGDIITDIVNIGIGGSDLGPQLAIEALKAYQDTKLKIHFINNIDPFSLENSLSKLRPETTLFIISSKSFNSIETLKNAEASIKWFNQASSEIEAKQKHFIAITNNNEKAVEFGIAQKIFLKFLNG